MKKLLSMVLTFVLLCGCVLFSAAAQDVPATSDIDPQKTYVNFDGELAEVTPGQTYRYTFYLGIDKKITSIDVRTFYDGEGLTLIKPLDEDKVVAAEKVFPNTYNKGMQYNLEIENEVRYNMTNISGVRFPVSEDITTVDKNILFTCEFRVANKPGVFNIDTRFMTLAQMTGSVYEVYIMDYEYVSDVLLIEAATFEQSTQDYICGDADGNGTVDVIDAAVIQKHLAQLLTIDEANLKAADANCDGTVNVVDASTIQKRLAGIEI